MGDAKVSFLNDVPISLDVFNVASALSYLIFHVDVLHSSDQLEKCVVLN